MVRMQFEGWRLNARGGNEEIKGVVVGGGEWRRFADGERRLGREGV